MGNLQGVGLVRLELLPIRRACHQETHIARRQRLARLLAPLINNNSGRRADVPVTPRHRETGGWGCPKRGG
eukprot:3141543-Pyramimonas_sp.AAC.1